jgi:hypothetical protein
MEVIMMGFGMGGIWMLLVIILIVLGILGLFKYLSK